MTRVEYNEDRRRPSRLPAKCATRSAVGQLPPLHSGAHPDTETLLARSSQHVSRGVSARAEINTCKSAECFPTHAAPTLCCALMCAKARSEESRAKSTGEGTGN